MTELETMQRAKMYMDKLARGIDPISDRALHGDTALNNPRLARCFSYVSGVLDRVIANGGHVGAVEKAEFAITPEQLARVEISAYPVRITEFSDALVRATGHPAMKRLSAAKISKWLADRGFLRNETGTDGKSHRVPTENGLRLGMTTQLRTTQDGDYLAVYYNANAQRFLVDNVYAIMEQK